MSGDGEMEGPFIEIRVCLRILLLRRGKVHFHSKTYTMS